MCNRASVIVAVTVILLWHGSAAADPPPGGKELTRTDLYGDPLPAGAIGRLGTIRFRHGVNINSLAYSPNGKLLASVGYGGVILWDSANGRPVAQFPSTEFSQIAFTDDGKELVASSRNSISILDIDTRKKRFEIELDNYSECFSLTPDGQGIITSSTAQHSRFQGTKDQWIELQHWDLATSKNKSTKRFPNLQGQHVIAPAAGDRNRMILFTTHDKIIKTWAADTGKLGMQFDGHPQGVSRIAVSPNGEVLASIGFDRTLRFWDTATGKLLNSLACNLVVSSVGFSPDSKTFACQVLGAPFYDDDDGIHLWDVPTGRVLRQIKRRQTGSFAFSPKGKTLAATESCSIHVWDLATGNECLPRPGHWREVQSVAFAADGKSLASGGSEGSVFLWRNLDGAKPQMLADDMKYVYNVAFAPHRSVLAASGRDGVRLWEPKTGKLLAAKKETDREGRAQFFPDGLTLLVAGDWQQAWLWALDSNTVRRHNKGSVEFGGGSLTVFNTAALSPDGNTLVETSLEGPGTVYDPQTGKTRSKVRLGKRGFGSDFMRFAPDSKTLILGEYIYYADSKVLFFDVPTSTVVRSSPKLKEFAPTAFAFSPDGHTLAVGGQGGSIVLLEFSTAGIRLRFRGHIGHINELAFSPDGNLLASASDDGTILIWQLDRLPGLKADPGPLSKKELQALWEDLGSADAHVAYQAIFRLRQDAKSASTVLIEQSRPSWKYDTKKVYQLISDLESDEYAVRTKAMAQLEALHDAVAPALREALRGRPPLETARRLESLLKKLALRQVQILRAMEVLEHGATAAGRQWFDEIAQASPETLLTREARLSLRRIKKASIKSRLEPETVPGHR